MRRVFNLSTVTPSDAVNVGCRSQQRGLEQSPFANPYRIGADGTLTNVIEKYRRWLLSQQSLLNRLRELRGRRLACWCKPAACHTDVLVEFVEADALLDELQAAGVAVKAAAGDLQLARGSAINATLRVRVAALKPAMIELAECRQRWRAAIAEEYRRLVEAVAASCRLPPDVLEAGRRGNR